MAANSSKRNGKQNILILNLNIQYYYALKPFLMGTVDKINLLCINFYFLTEASRTDLQLTFVRQESNILTSIGYPPQMLVNSSRCVTYSKKPD